MIDETDRQFNDRRALEEKKMADQATQGVQAIAHDKLSKLHAREADASICGDAPHDAALEITGIEGTVTITAAGVVTSLTPLAAVLTSDRLLARARDAERQPLPL